MEKAVTELQSDLETALSSSLKYLEKVRPLETGKLKVDPRIVEKFPLFEQLLWVLQQQACYVAQLSMCLSDDKDAETTFYSVVDSLYKELSNDRVLHLFLAMLKLMIAKEIEHAKTSQKVFLPGHSRVFEIFSKFALK